MGKNFTCVHVSTTGVQTAGTGSGASGIGPLLGRIYIAFAHLVLDHSTRSQRILPLELALAVAAALVVVVVLVVLVVLVVAPGKLAAVVVLVVLVVLVALVAASLAVASLAFG